MKNQCLVSLLTAIVLLALSTGIPAGAMDMKTPQKIVVHLGNYTNDLHAAFMAVKLATLFTEKGAETTLFVNLEGVRIVDKRTPNNLKWGTSPEIGGLYDKFIEAGGKTVVCPHCAMAAGLEADNLRKGASIADTEALATLFLEADKVIDY